MFSPYTEVKDPNPEARDSMRVLMGRARENKQFLFLFVNNRLEGNAPLTILSLVSRDGRGILNRTFMLLPIRENGLSRTSR